jgi:hypothetical protein
MATYNADKMLAGAQTRYLPLGYGLSVIAKVSLTTALVLNDVINLVPIEANPVENNNGPVISFIAIDVDKLDSNGAPTITLDLGDSGAAQRYLAASTIAQNGGQAQSTKAGVIGYAPFASSFNTYTTPSLATYTIFATVHAAPATFQAGQLRCLVDYTYDP